MNKIIKTNSMEKIKIQLLDGGVAPQATSESLDYQLVIPRSVRIEKGKQEIPLGFSMKLPKNKVALLMARDDVARKGILGYFNWGDEGPYNIVVKNEPVDEDRFNFISSKKDQFYLLDFNVFNVGGQKAYNVHYHEKSTEPARIPSCEVKMSMVTCIETGEVKLRVDNRGENPFYIEGGACIAIMMIVDVPEVELEVCENVKDNDNENEEPDANKSNGANKPNGAGKKGKKLKVKG